MTYDLTPSKILHRAGQYVVIKDGRQYTVCAGRGVPVAFFGGGAIGLHQAIRSAERSDILDAAWNCP